jgi:hypothetical protein
MTQVIDYSAGFPGAQAIRDAGYAGAVRYIGFPDRRKCATASELADFMANQIGMALVYENTLTEWRGGYSAGQAGAHRARNHANSIGFPSDRPIYVAIDQDVVTNGEFDRMTDYLQGAGSVLGGPTRTGVYGEADAIDHAREQGVATWFWQTAAWSRGRRTACHLYQHVGTVYVGGVACDVNDAQSDDWGQHNGSTRKAIAVHGKDEVMIVECKDRGSQVLVTGGVVVGLGPDSAGPINSGDVWPRLQLTGSEFDELLAKSAAMLSVADKLDVLAKAGGGSPSAGTYVATGSITLTPEGA